MKVRESKVRELMEAALDGMAAHAGDATVNEVLSTHMTLARAAILAAKVMGADSAALQAYVSQLYLDCVDETSTDIRH